MDSGSLNHISGSASSPATPPTTNIDSPAVGLDQHERQQRGQHRADVVAGHHPGDGRAGATLARVLGHERQRGGQAGAEAEAGQEPQRRELGDVLGERHREGEHREQGDAGDQRDPATEAVRQRADGDGADADTDEAERGGRGERGVGEAEVAGLRERRDDGADHDQVEPVEGDGDPAQEDGPEARGGAGAAGAGPGGGGGHQRCSLPR